MVDQPPGLATQWSTPAGKKRAPTGNPRWCQVVDNNYSSATNDTHWRF